jgi:DNA-binding MarR family transcriptional regulator
MLPKQVFLLPDSAFSTFGKGYESSLCLKETQNPGTYKRPCLLFYVYTYNVITLNTLDMKLEQEIQQKKFYSEYEKLIVNVLFTGNWMNLENTKHLKSFGLTLPQYNILRILRGQYPNPATVNLLIERMLDKSSNASRIVDRLLLKSLVTRRICKNDRRSVDVTITEKGLELLKKIDDHQKIWGEKFSTLTKDEAKKLNELLDKLRG